MGSKSVAVVTAADSRYFGLLEGLLDSLDDAGVPQTWSRCVMDVGLDEQQRVALATRGIRLQAPDWCLEFPGRSGWEATGAWFKAMVNRPFLPDIFQDHGVYLWIDSDAWVQDASCLHGMVEAAVGHDAIALVVEQFGRALNLLSEGPDGQPRTAVISEASIRANIARCYAACFGAETTKYADGPITNSGVFAVAAGSSVWRAWRKYLARGLGGGVKHTLVEQQSLNLACLEGEIDYIPMPTGCNWNLTTMQPAWNAAIASLVDPGQPDLPIGVIHCTDVKQCTRFPVHDLDGSVLDMPLRYRDFRHWRASTRSGDTLT